MISEKLLDLLRNVLSGCKLDVIPVASSDRISVILPERAMILVEFIWARLVLLLCEQRVVHGALSVPHIQCGEASVVWVEDVPIVFHSLSADVPRRLTAPPNVPAPIAVGLGGGSGSGKTTFGRLLKEAMPGEVFTYPAFTNRPKRPTETEGGDYFFRTGDDLENARIDIRYSDFVEARGNWYWIDQSILLKNIWQRPDAVHLFFISQRHHFERRRILFPDMKWIWIRVSEKELERRLLVNCDRDLDSTLAYNRKLTEQEIDHILNLIVINEYGDTVSAVAAIAQYFKQLQKERKNK